jgi:hypothetical protein
MSFGYIIGVFLGVILFIYLCYHGSINYSKPKEESGVGVEMKKAEEIPKQTVVVIHSEEERRQCIESDHNTPSCSKEPQRLYEMD